MWQFSFHVLVFFLGLISLSICYEDTVPILVQIVFRHGDRTPVTVYPNDPNKESIWEKYGGLGQLTQKGMKQHYDYGLYLRDRYKNFLDETYNRERVMVKSTTYDRTIMSVESLLASLYKPVDFQVWNPDVKWQPIPVVTANLDSLFIPSCPRYDELFDEISNTDEFKSANDQFKDLIDIATKESGYQDMSLKNLWQIADTVFIERNNDLELPKWVVDNYDQLMKSRDIDFYFKYRTVEMARLTSGGVLNEMKKNIVSKHKGNSTLQLALYSAHDTYVAAFVKLLGLSDTINAPPYTSSLILELRKSTKASDYYVFAYLKNNTADEPINPVLLPIAGCQKMCPLDDFMKIISKKVVENPNSACLKLGPSIKPINLLTNLTFMLSSGLSLVVLLLVSVCAIRTVKRLFKKRQGYRQQEL